ncbi:MAG: transposase [Methylotenera sp.]|nr:transposase [Methylotenera sp.]
MRTFGLHKNTVFNWNKKIYKVERITPEGQMLLECMETGELIIASRQHLLNEFKEGKLEANIDKVHGGELMKQLFSRTLNELSEKTLSQVKRKKHYLTSIYENGTPIFTHEYLVPLIIKAAAEINDKKPPHATTIYRWHKKFCTTQDSRSLIPRTDRRGSRVVRVGKNVINMLVETAVGLFQISPQTTIKSIYDKLLGKIQEENTKLLCDEALKPPSRSTVYRMFSKVEFFEKAILRLGKKVAEKLFRLVKNKVVTTQILERVEIDHTPLDLFLIDENTFLPLGRPTVTIIIDHFSRMILGYFISFENPSTAAVMSALRHAILPKQPVKGTFPNLKIEHDWVSYGVPDLMVLDNGLEFHSDALESVAFDLGIRMEFCPKHEPRFKGTVERFLKTFNYSFASQIPGASFARWHLRGDYDPQKHAVLTLGEFTHIFEKWALDIYAQTKHRGLGTTPWAKWHEGLQSRELRLPMSIKDLQKRIGKVDTRSARRDGILIKGIRYQSDALGGILRAYGEGVRVRVLFDPHDLGEIQVWAPDAEESITVQAINQSYARGLSEQQNEFIRTQLREQGDANVNQEQLIKARYDLSSHIEMLFKSRHLKDRKRGGKLSGINSNNPEGNFLKNSQTQTKRSKHKTPLQKGIPQNIYQPFMMPEILPTFRMKNRGDKNAN